MMISDEFAYKCSICGKDIYYNKVDHNDYVTSTVSVHSIDNGHGKNIENDICDECMVKIRHNTIMFIKKMRKELRKILDR